MNSDVPGPSEAGQPRAPQSIPRIDLDPFGAGFLSDPFAFYESLHDAGAVFWIAPLGVYGMARFAQVKQALEDWQTFCSSRGVGLSDFSKETPWRQPSLLLETDPPDHNPARQKDSYRAAAETQAEQYPAYAVEHSHALRGRLIRFTCHKFACANARCAIIPDSRRSYDS
jgi:cytochrome P450